MHCLDVKGEGFKSRAIPQDDDCCEVPRTRSERTCQVPVKGNELRYDYERVPLGARNRLKIKDYTETSIGEVTVSSDI